MKLRNILCLLAVYVLLAPSIWAANTNPVVSNVTFNITGYKVTVHYDVTDAEQSKVTIAMEVSSNAGAKWDYYFVDAAGDIGDNIAIGTGKTITWNYYGGYDDNQFQIKIIANDLADPQIYYASKIYNFITIGSQTWLKENLDVGIQVKGSDNQSNYGTIRQKYCYNDDPANCTKYGGLYQWDIAMTGYSEEGVQGICPLGWHIPTNGEFQTLINTVGNNSNALKAIGEGTGIGAGTNTSGFSALLTGYRSTTGTFNTSNSTRFWSSTLYQYVNADILSLHSNDNGCFFTSGYSLYGFSVRCIKD